MPDASVNCCITSPPYWGLRDYNLPPSIWGGAVDCEHDWIEESIKTEVGRGNWAQATNGRGEVQGEIAEFREPIRARAIRGSCSICGAWRGCFGLEPTPEMYVDHAVSVFREVRRVLREDGTLWLNLGDSYNAHPGQRKTTDAAGPKQVTNEGAQGAPSRYVANLKPKDLVGIPWRVAFALQADGWWLRSDIIWAKPAPMPESVTDRPTRSHEYIFLLSKSERYYYDHEAIKEPAVCGHPSGNGYKREARLSYQDERGARGSDEQWQPASWRGSRFDKGKTKEAVEQTGAKVGVRPSAPKGSFNGKTEAMADTGQNAFRAITEMRNLRDVWTVGAEPFPEAHFATFPPKLIEPCVIGGCPEGGTILDPFFGAGTTGFVARKHRRKFVGIELNPEYVAMAEKRMSQEVLFG
jgi:DNA modification methylase